MKKPGPGQTPVKPDEGRKGEEIPAGIKSFLRSRLLLTREIPNGRDFLFSEASEDIHSALKTLVEFERGHEQVLRCDYVKVEEYFMLRIIGSTEVQERIQRFFNGS